LDYLDCSRWIEFTGFKLRHYRILNHADSHEDQHGALSRPSPDALRPGRHRARREAQARAW